MQSSTLEYIFQHLQNQSIRFAKLMPEAKNVECYFKQGSFALEFGVCWVQGVDNRKQHMKVDVEEIHNIPGDFETIWEDLFRMIASDPLRRDL